MSHGHEEDKHEIVIVRHAHGDHDEGHHGGAWKIAFADFMTAMMCFFLVMWLINASNEETKAAVASYFNPVKLTDRNASRKSIDQDDTSTELNGEDSQQSPADKGESKHGPSKNEGTVDSSQIKKEADEKLFSDPYAVLAEIASDTGVKQNISDKGDGGAQSAGPATGASGGEAYRDPFAPDFWSQQVALPSEAEAGAEPEKTEPTLEAVIGTEPATGKAAAETAIPGRVAAKPTTGADARPNPDRTAEPTEATQKAADRIRRELAQALLPDDRMKDGISVVATDEGVRVSVTDQLAFGMFEVGSALPRRDLVLAMEKIGRAVSQQKGDITISGYTDGRPFKPGGYDNWRLSTARAHSAYYMLVRAGLDEKRVTEVAGFADRKPKDKDNPLAAVNRRIEILLKVAP